MIEADITTRLKTFAGLNALIAGRVYGNILPQNVTLPALSYRRVSAQRFSCMGQDLENVEARYQVDVWANSYREARGVAEQVREALQRWNNGASIQDIFMDSEIDLYEDDSEVHHVAMDFIIHYRE